VQKDRLAEEDTVDEPDVGDDLSPWLRDLEEYAREYTREDLAGLAADGQASYNVARAVWVVQGPAGPFEVSHAEVLDANPVGYLPDGYEAG
jgi:hypothetical protein